jgi:hypothetical protein
MGRRTPPPGRQALLPGAVQGALTVLEVLLVQEGSQRRRYYRCQCACGTVFTVRADHVHRGNTRSCGCLRVQVRRAGMAARMRAWWQAKNAGQGRT